MSQQAKGHGILQVSASLYSELDSPGTPEEWHKALLLPDTFTVESIAKNDRLEVYELTVSSRFLPDEEGIYITPTYSRNTQEVDDMILSQVSLNKIEFTQLVGESWKHLGIVEVVS